ncbi:MULTISPECIES: MOSC domain-containing protein [unclassified Chelatococcus]|uniref:MOSC domain-containing protein n=1 Tax=unclassified Chelatococcus TaxID=2638111 RepID=UPI001BCFCE5D|nr:MULTISPECIES: MOSC domain-containing protein [unclassified Chelatococcus]MBS7698256.1 MOSC domain-containing protein [Chelatococcus sp. YT9]MBX3560039.1 MOSC domain-containing protein [Chelatococcus sp.]
MSGVVVAVSRAASHAFSKANEPAIRLLAGLGVEGDAHCGETVKHRSRVRADPTQPNLRQVHLIHSELFDELRLAGFSVVPGAMGENITTSGIDLLALPTGAVLAIGSDAAVEITGLRNPCSQIDDFQPGLLKAVLGRDAEGSLIRKAGIMGIVRRAGMVRPDDVITIHLPSGPHRPLERV